jgi:two-component system cell cycle response regulator
VATEILTAQILVIDTDTDSQVILSELIRDMGLEAQVENNVQRALRKLDQEEFALVITDNILNGYSGIDVLKRLKKNHPLTEVIVVAGEATLDAAIAALNLGAHSFIEKPITFSEMQLQIKQALAKRSFALKSQWLLEKTAPFSPVLQNHLNHLIDFNQLSRRLINSMEYQQIIDTALRGLKSMVMAEVCALLIVEGDEAQLHVRSEKPGLVAHLGDIKEGLLLSWKTLSQKQLHPEKLKIDFQTKQVGKLETASSVLLQSTLCVPLLVQTQVIGLLNVASTQPVAFDSETSHFLNILAEYIAAILVNASRHRHIQLLASTDGLTGLYNYRTLHERLKHEFDRSKRYGSPLSLIMLDIDLFKKVNDDYGHTQGDVVLREVADILRKSTREVDLLARYGGDEFVVILPETQSKNAALLAERIRLAVRNHAFRVTDTGTHITISLGLATYPAPGISDSKEFIHHADRALYEAKNSGQDKVIVAT